jgi:anti-anti-sigma factor
MSHEAELRAELRAAVEADANRIVVDLTECEFIDSSAIRALLLSREEKNSDHNGETLAVAASSDQILRILGVMGLDKVLPIEPTVEQAAAALSG